MHVTSDRNTQQAMPAEPLLVAATWELRRERTGERWVENQLSSCSPAAAAAS